MVMSFGRKYGDSESGERYTITVTSTARKTREALADRLHSGGSESGYGGCRSIWREGL